MSFAANCFHRTEVKCVKKHALLYEFDDNVAVDATTNRNCPVSGKIAPAEAVVQVGVRFPCRRRVCCASGGSGPGSSASGGGSKRLPTSASPLASSNDRLRALQTPQANISFPNVNTENVTEHSR